MSIGKEVKSIVVRHEEQDKALEMVMLLVRRDHWLNEIKATKVPGLKPFRFATDAEIQARLKAPPGSLGPTGHPGLKIVAARTVPAMSDFCTAANKQGFHFTSMHSDPPLPHPPT